MMFNVREAAEKGVNIGTNALSLSISEQPTMPDMVFAEPRAPQVTSTPEQSEVPFGSRAEEKKSGGHLSV